MFDLFFNKNFGKIGSELPYSEGLAISGGVPLEKTGFLKKLFIYGIYSEISCFYSSKDDKSIKSLVVSAGPLWRFPVNIFNYRFNFNISATIGAGWFLIKNEDIEESAIKSNLKLNAGPAFELYPVVISPRLRVDYFYDGFARLVDAGCSIGAGYRF